MTAETKAAEKDGRLRRSVRSRERILDALCALVEAGNLHPTGQQVAERAGVSLRTVFRHFEDMEGLNREMHERVERVMRPLAAGPRVRGPLVERVRELVRRRTTLFERATPFLRSGAIHRWKSPYLSKTHAADVRELRGDLARTLPEADEVPAARHEALELVTSFEAWDRLRADQKLGRDRAREVMVEAVMALLRE
ncbi:MAG: TetR family transcriptional regulator [Myxococcota bacterium]